MPEAPSRPVPHPQAPSAAPPARAHRPVVAAFDFDGTITTRDTFLPFLVRVCGWRRVAAALLALAIPGLGVWLGRVSRDAYKAWLIDRLLAGASVDVLQRVGNQYETRIFALCRPAALERIRWHQAQGHRLVMVSASLNYYLEPMARRLGFDDLLCTRLVEADGLCTGQLAGENCRAQAKVHYLQALLGPLEKVELYAYGDSAGDAQLLAAADHPAYRPFRD